MKSYLDDFLRKFEVAKRPKWKTSTSIFIKLSFLEI